MNPSRLWSNHIILVPFSQARRSAVGKHAELSIGFAPIFEMSRWMCGEGHWRLRTSLPSSSTLHGVGARLLKRGGGTGKLSSWPKASPCSRMADLCDSIAAPVRPSWKERRNLRQWVRTEARGRKVAWCFDALTDLRQTSSLSSMQEFKLATTKDCSEDF